MPAACASTVKAWRCEQHAHDSETEALLSFMQHHATNLGVSKHTVQYSSHLQPGTRVHHMYSQAEHFRAACELGVCVPAEGVRSCSCMHAHWDPSYQDTQTMMLVLKGC